MSKSLHIEADVAFETEGHSVHLTGNGSVISVHVDDFNTLKVASPSYLSGSQRVSMLRQVHSFLCRADLILQVTVGDRVVARLGAGTQTSWLSRLFGLGPLQISARDLFRLSIS